MIFQGDKLNMEVASSCRPPHHLEYGFRKTCRLKSQDRSTALSFVEKGEGKHQYGVVSVYVCWGGMWREIILSKWH